MNSVRSIKQRSSFFLAAGIALLFSLPNLSAQQPQGQATLSPGQHFAALPGIRLAYRVAGHGPILVEQSVGWGAGSGYLQLGLKPLEQYFTVIYVDARGSGLSDRPADAARMSDSDMVDDLEHLRAYLGLSSINLMGHSSGGALALGYAERYPERVRKLVLLDTEVTDMMPEMMAGAKRMVQARAKDPRFSYAAAHFFDPPPATDAAFGKLLNDTLAMYMYDTAHVADFEKTELTPPSAWTATAWEKANAGHLLPESVDAGKVQAKTLIVSGRWDAPCPVETAEKLHTLLPGSRLVVYEKSGHFAWIEVPDQFFPAVIHFLEA